MGKTGKFFFAMAWFGFGVIMGFLIAPIKQGIDITIASNNVVDGMDTLCDDDDEDEQDD